ncbi:hypothetical protein WDV06_25055 [Streptomyces racemochromogenes]|uniref:Uncharacterized protein n=1 Tax=Streptomyces racemochromogenes TaxID=67353 RepID=A0ABW7PIV8_9ACTN
MGGWENTRSGRHGRHARRGALLLLLALAMAAGTGFLCVRGGAAVPGARAAEGPVRAYAAHGVAGPYGGSGPRVACVSPHELPGCSPLAHVTPAVLPAPPPAVTAARPGPAPRALPAATGPVRPPGTLARAPDLHALQVLRT